MASGKVKWFNAVKGFGFIEPDEGGSDVFVHITAVQEAGLKGLAEGQPIEYDLLPAKNGRDCAQNLKVAEGGEASGGDEAGDGGEGGDSQDED